MRTLVAITRWAYPFEMEIEALSQMLHVGQYDLRMRIAGPIPVLVPCALEGVEARELAAALMARGHGVVNCPETEVPANDKMFCPREFSLGETALDGSYDKQVTLAYGDIAALVRATAVATESTVTTTTKKVVSIGRAVMTGGLMMRKKKSKTSNQEASTREQVLYVVSRSSQGSMLLRETRLRYGGLGDQMQSTTPQNFAILVSLLKKRAPAALYDERLVAHPRTSGSIQVAGTAKDHTVTQSNASANDVAVHMLVLAHLQNQL